ncbi:MAG: dihydroorotase [Pseudomonadota bacterium]
MTDPQPAPRATLTLQDKGPFDLIIHGGTLLTPAGTEPGDIGVRSGMIAAIGDLATIDAGERLDATGLHVLPGVIDSQVHFREPGMTHKEDLASGSRAAVLGGVTTVFEMPNTNPLTTTADALADKVRLAHHRMHCDFAFYVGGTRENVEEIPDLERLPGSAGIKVFIGSSTGDLLLDDLEGLDAVIAKISRRAAFHCEDEARLEARKHLRREGDPTSHPLWRDPEAALIATRNLVGLAMKHRKRVHVLHISTAEEMAYLQHHRQWASVEVTPHHLTLDADIAYAELGTRAQMNPPVRDTSHRDVIWQALANGIVDVLGSDHAPHTLEEKAATYPASPSGMTGVQTLVPIMLDHVNAGRLTLERFVDLTAHGPQRLFGLAGKGRIMRGYDADLTLVDLAADRTIRNEDVASTCGWTPYDGRSVKGWPIATVVRGRTVMRDGELIGEPIGEAATFHEAGV